MVQFFKGAEDPRDRAYGQLASALGQGLGNGINTYYANKALDSVIDDKENADLPTSEKMGKLQSALMPYGEKGQEIFRQRMQIEQQAYNEKQAKVQAKEAKEKEDRLFAHQKALQKQKDVAAKERAGLKPPPGGISAQPIPPEQLAAIDKFISENPNATANELSLGLGKAGVNPTYSAPYVQNTRETEKAKSKSNEAKDIALRGETLPVKKEIAQKAQAAREGIENKKHLLDLVRKGDINDPTFAAIAQSLPLNLGKRLLSNDTVQYKAGLIEEFGDLRNLFQGQTRVKEIELLEEKIADIYLTDSQKEAILNSRINALQRDIIREDVAAEMEAEGKNYPLLTYQQELDKRAKPRMDALFNRILDEQQATIKDAENKKKMPLDIKNPEDKEIIQQIFKEAGNDPKKAEALAKKKGYHW